MRDGSEFPLRTSVNFHRARTSYPAGEAAASDDVEVTSSHAGDDNPPSAWALDAKLSAQDRSVDTNKPRGALLMPAIAIFNLMMNVRDLDRSVRFYELLGMERQFGFDLRPGEIVPTEYYEARGVDPNRVGTTVSLAYPHDPFMHLQLQAWNGELTDAGWPPQFDQLGMRGWGLLVDDVNEELEFLRARGATVEQEALEIQRKWGPTRVGLVRDPDGNFLELISVDFDPTWDPTGRSVLGSSRFMIHFQINTENLLALWEFYDAFGFEEDNGNQKRPGNALDPDRDNDVYSRAFGFRIRDELEKQNMMRLPTDPSRMHLTLMGFKQGTLKVPSAVPTFNQKGIARLGMLSAPLAEMMADLRRRGTKIWMENERNLAHWGDSVYSYCADPDGNVVTPHEYFPPRHFGERW